MLALIIYCGTVFGIAWGIGMSDLSYPFRRLIAGDQRIKSASSAFRWLIVTGLQCPGCVSTHLGWLAFLSGLTPPGIFNHWWEAALFSATSSLVIAKAAGLTDSAPLRGGGVDGRSEEVDDGRDPSDRNH